MKAGGGKTVFWCATRLGKGEERGAGPGQPCHSSLFKDIVDTDWNRFLHY